MLGLITTEQLAATRGNNARRQIFYAYPQGRFPLAGLLSLAENGDDLTDVICGWNEERYQTHRSITAEVAAGQGPFSKIADATDDEASPMTKAAGATATLHVGDETKFRVRDVIRIAGITTSTTVIDVTALVTAVTTDGSNVLSIKFLEAATAVLNTGMNVGRSVWYIGTATPEGDRSLDGAGTVPIRIENRTQIFRTAWRMTGTGVKMSQQYDKKGAYKKLVKHNSLRHMEGQEQALIWGVKREESATTLDGETTVRGYMGGLLWYLRQWELQNTVNGGAFNYVVGASDLTLAPWESSPDKRIINVGIENSGAITKDQWNELRRRAFLRTSNTGFEKLIVCGSKVLAAINGFVEDNSIRMIALNPKEDAYGMQIYRLDDIYGTLLIKCHPLFNENPALQSDAFIVDMGNIIWHDMEGRESDLLKNRQPNDADYRKDEWLGEGTTEFRFPESHMYIRGLEEIIS